MKEPSWAEILGLWASVVTLTFAASSAAWAGTIYGSSSPDTIRGTPRADTIYGYGCADLLKGLEGQDRVYGLLAMTSCTVALAMTCLEAATVAIP
jgi:hypothetical protein